LFNGTSRWIAWGSASQWIKIDLATPQKAFTYQLSSGHIDQQISSWILQGSNDDSDWTDLDTVENHPLSIDAYSNFTISTPNAYRYYRLYINQVVNNGYPSLSGFTLLTSGTPAIKAHWENVSNNLPTSTQFIEKGMDNLSSINRKVTTLEPISMSDKSEILGVGEIGKVFSKTVDLKKFFGIRSIRTEVK